MKEKQLKESLEEIQAVRNRLDRAITAIKRILECDMNLLNEDELEKF